MKPKYITTASIVLAVIIALGLFAFPVQAQLDSCCCSIPVGDTGPTVTGRRIPPFVDINQMISPDGKKLTFIRDDGDSAYILDLTTLLVKPIIIQTGLSQVVDGFFQVVWCPYDTDLLAVSVDIEDTFYSGIHGYGNFYTYRLSTGECQRITPVIFGPIGDTGSLLDLNNWTCNSKKGNDTLEIYSWSLRRDSITFYVPENQMLLPSISNGQTIAESPSDKHHFMSYQLQHGIFPLPPYILDSIPLPNLDSSVERLQWGSFSSNEKLLAISVSPNGQGPPADTIFPQVWVYRVDSMSAPPIVINFQKSFCMYSFWGIYAEFITDSTLAVSMHKDGDESSPLWEITLDGRIVRQLTFLPEWPDGVTEVVNSKTALRVFPNPSTDELQILGGEAGTARLFDLLGRERMDAYDDGSGASLDVSYIEPGIYFLRLDNQSTKVEIAR